MSKKRVGYFDQIVEACVLTPTINESNHVDPVTGWEMLLHLLTLPWKVLLSFLIPPKHWLNGWFSLFMSLAVIGLLTVLITDLVNVLECTLDLRTSVTGITLLSIGFSLPELFTSGAAAKFDFTADSAIAHVMGINAINFFLGIGLPWVIAAGYAHKEKVAYPCDQPEVVWSLLMLIGLSVIGLIVIGLRRCICKGELGGNAGGRVFTMVLLIVLWLAFVALVTLQVYKVIDVDIVASIKNLSQPTAVKSSPSPDVLAARIADTGAPADTTNTSAPDNSASSPDTTTPDNATDSRAVTPADNN
jgi:solute carrier family 8 (sodium/calcium exchanger)